jgi:hypothetical protein
VREFSIGNFALGSFALICGRSSSASASLAEQRALDPRRHQALACRRNLDPPVLVPDRARPGMRPMHQHAVRESHAAEPNLLRGHRAEG